MMAEIIILRCVTCRSYNKHQYGSPRFVPRQTDYKSLTEAYKHMLETLQDGRMHEIELTNLGEQ